MILFLVKNYLILFASAWIILGFALAIECISRVYRFIFEPSK